MGKIAYVFPGQGAQQVGMGKAMSDAFPEVKRVFEEADEALGYDLSRLCFEGPEEELKLTYHTQPAILTTSIAYYEVFKQQAPRPDFVAGHSLGEYSALIAAEAMSFADGVATVHKRGTFMDEAVPAGQGAMAAVMGGDRETIGNICEEITLAGNAVQMANMNSPKQIVISGTKEGVDQASKQLKEAGIRRVIPLVVSGPFHSDLMKPAASKLAHELEKITINTAKVPVVTNVDARPAMLGDDLEHALVEQVFSPVLWEDSVQWMIEQGVDTFVEIGPGQVLSGLIKKIDRDVTIHTVSDQESLVHTLEKLK
ncbi:ACP S-malonyltransferase [Caldalkalibacillus salinus]|uniref:ACP S-malonyltransferase n=1 Tax=Caldalkalibacillus salinus TaxID=2803787 RepID=UPI001921F9A2|nr:ACP S-malonyltransferase [Caldalkalibacillus salinus]